MFEKASRLKLRFESSKGNLGIEDLWEMPLSSRDKFNLDMVAKNVNKHIKTLEEESFVNINPTSAATVSNLKLNILKHIIDVKMKEAQAKEDSVLKKENRDKIIKIIEEKQDESLKGKSIEELQALIN